MWFPADPAHRALRTLAADRRMSWPAVARHIGVPERTLYRLLAGSRVAWNTADRVAVGIGLHPCQLWPDWFAHSADPERTDGAAAGAKRAESPQPGARRRAGERLAGR